MMTCANLTDQDLCHAGNMTDFPRVFYWRWFAATVGVRSHSTRMGKRDHDQPSDRAERRTAADGVVPLADLCGADPGRILEEQALKIIASIVTRPNKGSSGGAG
jgi:hypothetical protein